MATRTITGPFNTVAGEPIPIGVLTVAPQGQGVVTGGAFARRQWVILTGAPTEAIDIVVPGNYRFTVQIDGRTEWDFVAAIGDDVLTDLTIQQVYQSAYEPFDPAAMVVREGDPVDRLVAPSGANAGDLVTVDADGTSLVAAPPGATVDAHYVYTQNSPAEIWIANHNLGKYPSVDLEDSIGRSFIAPYTHTSVNQTVITCTPAMSGRAFFN